MSTSGNSSNSHFPTIIKWMKPHQILWKSVPENLDSSKLKQTFVDEVEVKLFNAVVDVDDFYLENKLKKGKIWTKALAKLELNHPAGIEFQGKGNNNRISIKTTSKLLQTDWKSKNYFRCSDKSYTWILKFKSERDRDRFAQTVFWKKRTSNLLDKPPYFVLETVESLLSYVGNLSIYPHLLRMDTLKLICCYLNTNKDHAMEEEHMRGFITKLYELTGKNSPHSSFCNLIIKYLRGNEHEETTIACITEVGRNIFAKLSNIDDSPWLKPVLIELLCFLGRRGQHPLRELISDITENQTSLCGENITSNFVKLVSCGVNQVYSEAVTNTNTKYSTNMIDADKIRSSHDCKLELTSFEEDFVNICKPLMTTLNCLCFDEKWCGFVAKSICRVPFISRALMDQRFLILTLPTILDLIDCKNFYTVDCLWHEQKLGWMDVFSPDKMYLKDCRLKRGQIFFRILERLVSPEFRVSYVPQYLVEVRKHYFHVLCDPRFENEIGVIYSCAKLLKFTNVVQPERNLLFSRLIATEIGKEVLLEMKIDGIGLDDCEQTSFDTAF